MSIWTTVNRSVVSPTHSAQRLYREVLTLQFDAIVRREAYLRYTGFLLGLILVATVVGVSLAQFSEHGYLALDPSRVQLIAIILSGLGAIFTFAQWRWSLNMHLRNELMVVRARLDLDRIDADVDAEHDEQ